LFFNELNLNQTLLELIIYLKLFRVKSITNGPWQGLQQEKKLQVGIRTKVENNSINLILKKYAYLTKQFPWITFWSVHNNKEAGNCKRLRGGVACLNNITR
jgi:hypothetical protein